MKIYKISQEVNNDWDTYDSCVVIAESAEAARLIRPDGQKWSDDPKYQLAWVRDPSDVIVEEIGEATIAPENPVICASYNWVK